MVAVHPHWGETVETGTFGQGIFFPLPPPFVVAAA
jgi:hypothetical protein